MNCINFGVFGTKRIFSNRDVHKESFNCVLLLLLQANELLFDNVPCLHREVALT